MIMTKKLTIILASIAVAATAWAAAPILINGAGATFPYPIYSKWFDVYASINPDVRFNYQSIGSGGGIKQVTAKTVDFGASDGPMTDQQLADAPGRLIHIPTVMGAVVVTYNVPGVEKGLKLNPDIVADIFLGAITKWNDPRISSANPGVQIPDLPLVVVHRSDGSGTTYIFVDYLSSVSGAWKLKVGKGTSVNWPVGLGGKGNEGVAGLVKQTPGALGYVELAYAEKNGLAYATIQNKSGKFIEPTLESTSKAADGVDIPSDFRVSLVNSANAEAYPIAGFTWLLIYRKMDDPVKGKAIVDFIKWAVHDGQKYAKDLLYAPLPEGVVGMIDKKLEDIQIA
ncbi:MAG: phosphate ABC transporter substrate-binding protein PstS [Candidatus Omnitrophica bacterium CG1_02_49_16]|nr:MAG: phosphate ABC transporter substrate-binding protein PstS [Candidatus Omnitrophica bacterium CG1_02_49_16]